MRILNYVERLKALDLATLLERREREDMIQIFKIFHDIDIMEIDNNFLFQHNQTRGHCFKFHREILWHSHQAYFIFNRSANLWISLPNLLVNAETVNGFKAGLDY